MNYRLIIGENNNNLAKIISIGDASTSLYSILSDQE